MRPVWFAPLLAVVAGFACANSGMGGAVRSDISLRMASVQQPIAGCYEQALARNRKLQGRMVLSFQAAAGTGKFTGVQVIENELPDPQLVDCVIGQIGSLALAQPQKSAVAVTYPLRFTPEDKKP